MFLPPRLKDLNSKSRSTSPFPSIIRQPRVYKYWRAPSNSWKCIPLLQSSTHIYETVCNEAQYYSSSGLLYWTSLSPNSIWNCRNSGPNIDITYITFSCCRFNAANLIFYNKVKDSAQGNEALRWRSPDCF